MTPAEKQAQIRGIVVEHDSFVAAVSALGAFHMPVLGGVPATGVVSTLIGDSRTGKTFATKDYAKKYPTVIGDTGLIMPVVYVDMPMEGGGGPRAILENIAYAIQLPFSLRMTNPALLHAILKTLVERKVDLLLLDEFEQVFRENDRRILGFGRGLIRKLVDLGTLSLVCIGLMPTYKLLHDDPQLAGRGGLPHKVLRPYNWKNAEERGAFRLLCEAFDAELPFNQRSGLAGRDLAERLFWVSQGNIGLLKSLIEAAGAHAINEDAEKIDQRFFADAYEYRKAPGTPFNPFRDDLRFAPNREVKVVPPVIKRGSARTVFSKGPEPDIHNGL